MGDNKVDEQSEKRLFADVELIKQKQEHSDKTLTNLLTEFINHSKTTNENLTQLTLSTRELVIESRTANKRIEDLEQMHETHVRRCEDDFRSMGKRVANLETWKTQEEARKEGSKESRRWWSDNWHKMLMVFVIAIPVVVALYQLVVDKNGTS